LTFGGTDPYSGYYGDDDQGQLSSLSALMAIGLFDFNGCVGESPALEITSPVFDRIKIKFPSVDNPDNITEFEIITKKRNPDDVYIQKVMLNGERWESFELPVTKFFEGGKLEIELGPKPNKHWGK
jgi:putative alpha-1,2-mannosidase